jgi:hypothetical protein
MDGSWLLICSVIFLDLRMRSTLENIYIAKFQPVTFCLAGFQTSSRSRILSRRLMKMMIKNLSWIYFGMLR